MGKKVIKFPSDKPYYQKEIDKMYREYMRNKRTYAKKAAKRRFWLGFCVGGACTAWIVAIVRIVLF